MFNDSVCTYVHCIDAIYLQLWFCTDNWSNKKETATSETRATMSMIY